MLCVKHSRPIRKCGTCLPRKYWPKGMKKCRCGVMIDKSWLKCGACVRFETHDWVENGFENRQAIHESIVQANEGR